MCGDGNFCNDGIGIWSIFYGIEIGGVNIDKVELVVVVRLFF